MKPVRCAQVVRVGGDAGDRAFQLLRELMRSGTGRLQPGQGGLSDGTGSPAKAASWSSLHLLLKPQVRGMWRTLSTIWTDMAKLLIGQTEPDNADRLAYISFDVRLRFYRIWDDSENIAPGA